MPRWYSPNRVSSSTPAPRPKRSVSRVGSSVPGARAPLRQAWYCEPG